MHPAGRSSIVPRFRAEGNSWGRQPFAHSDIKEKAMSDIEPPTYVHFSFGAPPNLGRSTQIGPLRARRGYMGSVRVLASYALVYARDGIAHYWDENGTVRDIWPGDVILVFPNMRHKYGPN